MAMSPLYISITYDKSQERVLLTLILFVILQLYTIVRQLAILVSINSMTHGAILNDLKDLHYLWKLKAFEKGTKDDGIFLLVNTYIEHMEARLMLAGKMLGVAIKKRC